MPFVDLARGLASSEGCGLRGNEAEREMGMGNG